MGVSNRVSGVAYLPESSGRIRVVSFEEELAYLSTKNQPTVTRHRTDHSGHGAAAKGGRGCLKNCPFAFTGPHRREISEETGIREGTAQDRF
jgi:hypothetical protein